MVFLIGLAVGSAINVVVSRFRDLKTFLTGRSVCDHCGRKLKPWQLIPVIGMLIQWGRCRFCGKPIPWRYPVVELISGAVALVLYQGVTPAYVLSFAFFTLLMVASLIDLQELIIPDSLMVVALLTAVLRVMLDTQHASSAILGAVVGAAIPALLVVPTAARAMGVGDLKLGAVVGLWLGFPQVIVAWWLGFVIGGVVAALMLATGRKKLADAVAFGPYLALSALITHRFGVTLLAYVTF